MKGRPINLRQHEVAGIQGGRRTQLRRVMKIDRRHDDLVGPVSSLEWCRGLRYSPSVTWSTPVTDDMVVQKAARLDLTGFRAFRLRRGGLVGYRCPYGQPGDQLLGRESFRLFYDGRADLHYIEYRDGVRILTPHEDAVTGLIERADWPKEPDGRADQRRTKWYSPICMPQAASRITMEITGVRVERARDISEDDAIRDGVHRVRIGEGYPDVFSAKPVSWSDAFEGAAETSEDPRVAYRCLYESMNGPASWKNDWVWVLEIRRLP